MRTALRGSPFLRVTLLNGRSMTPLGKIITENVLNQLLETISKGKYILGLGAHIQTRREEVTREEGRRRERSVRM